MQNRAYSNLSPLVYLYGLPDNATKDQVKALLEPEGKILNLYIHHQRDLTGPIGGTPRALGYKARVLIII